MNLQTFVYTGRWIPIYLNHALELKDVSLYFMDNLTLEDALIALPSVLPKVRNLSLRTLMSLEVCISHFGIFGVLFSLILSLFNLIITNLTFVSHLSDTRVTRKLFEVFAVEVSTADLFCEV
jgi:hypothetical protein